MTYSHIFLTFLTVASVLLYVNADYIGSPASTNTIKAVLKDSVYLQCEYSGSDDSGQFLEWYKDDVSVKDEKPGHYVVTTDKKRSTLVIKTFVTNDSKVQTWRVKTNKPDFEEPSQCRFGKISLIPSPQSIETNRQNEKIDTPKRSIRRSEDTEVTLKCIIEPPPENPNENDIKWDFSKDGESFSEFPFNITDDKDQITIKQVKRINSGYYRCTANNISFAVILRVKDRLAALWPFIGIVSVVLVLVIIILIFEKRQKSNKKSSTDEDDQDQANDPLVRTTASATDSDNKKRAVNT